MKSGPPTSLLYSDPNRETRECPDCGKPMNGGRMTRSERAAQITSYVRTWAKEEATRFAKLGIALYDFERELLYQEVSAETGEPFGSFPSWLADCTPGEGVPPARSTAYAALRMRKELLDIPEAAYVQIPHGALLRLRGASTGVRVLPEVLEAASRGERALVRHVTAEHPGQAWEETESLRFRPTTSQKQIVMRAIEDAIHSGRAGSKEEWLEDMAVRDLQEQEYEQGKQRIERVQ